MAVTLLVMSIFSYSQANQEAALCVGGQQLFLG